MPAIIPALIIGAGAVGAAAISSSAANNAASDAQSAAAQNNALESQIYNTNKGLEQPYITSGDNAETALNGFLGLGGSPQATQTAFNNYLNSTGYNFDLSQGEQAAEQNAAAGGMANSGATEKALDAYGTGLAQQYGQQYVTNLQGEVSTGSNSANALAGQGENYAQQVSSNNNSAATTSANAGLAGANAITGVIGQGINAYGLGKGGTSFIGGSSGGATSYNAFLPDIGG
jgi:hypothetical protein